MRGIESGMPCGDCPEVTFALPAANRLAAAFSALAGRQSQIYGRVLLETLIKEKSVKKIFLLASLMLALAFGGAQAAEIHKNPAGNNIDEFTGKYWLNSKHENQLAYLYGIESAISVEARINEQKMARAKKGKKPASTLSRFEKGWMEAFTDVSREQIANDVTAWYNAHPDEVDRPVLAVIWHELIMPRIEDKTEAVK